MFTEGGQEHPNRYALCALSSRYCHLQYVVNGFIDCKPSGGWETTGNPTWKPLGILLMWHVDVEVLNPFNHVQTFQNQLTRVPPKEGCRHKVMQEKTALTPLQMPPDRQCLLSLLLPGGSQGISVQQRPISPSTEEHRGLKAGRSPDKGLRGSSYFNMLQIV